MIVEKISLKLEYEQITCIDIKVMCVECIEVVTTETSADQPKDID